MKKFSKIAAVMLTVLLLCGLAFSFTASAEEEETLQLNKTGAADNVINDYEGTGTKWYDPWTGYRDSAVEKQQITDAKGNKYLRFAIAKGGYAAEVSTVTNAQIGPSIGGNVKNTAAYDFATIDFDLASDSYRYSWKVGNTTYYSTSLDDIPAGVNPTNEGLAYPSGFYYYLRWSDGSSNANFGALNVSLEKDANSGKYYAKSSHSTKTIYLSNEIGVFDHFSFVIRPNYVDGELTSGDIFCYINGELLYKYNFATYAKSSYLQKLTFTYSYTWTDEDTFHSRNDKYATALDNYAINFYPSTNENTKYLHEFFDNYSADRKLYECDGVVYNKDYTFHGLRTVAEIEHSNGTKSTYPNAYAAVKGIRAGDFVHMYEDFKNFTPTSHDVNNVTFISHNGAVLELSKEAKGFYKVQHSGDKYTIRLADGGVKINWYDGVDNDLVMSQSLIPFVAPNNDFEVLKITGKIDIADDGAATIELLKGWMWDTDGDEKGDTVTDKIFKAYTVEEINKIMENGVPGIVEKGISEINIYPVFEAPTLLYTIEKITGEGSAYFAPDNDFADFTKFSALKDIISGLEQGEEVKVTLYSNYHADSLITVPAGVIVNFDINGRTITSDSNVFAVSEASTLNVFSTRENGIVNSPSIITSNGIDACTINIGEMSGFENASGSNVKFTANKILNLVGSNDDIANAKKIVVNVNGGTYTANTGSYTPLFPISEMDMIISISDAIISAGPEIDIFSIDNQYKTSAEISVVGSKIIADSAIGSWSSSCKMYIEKSTITGIDLMKDNISLGEYNLIKSTDANFNPNSIRTSQGVAFALATGGKASLPISETENVKFNVLSFIPSVKEQTDRPAPFNNIVIDTVEWHNQNGGIHATTYWVAGSKINVDHVSTNGLGIDENTRNGWYALEYSSWTRDNDAEGIVYKPVAEKIVKSFSEVYVSLGISNEFMYEIYVPAPSDEIDADIEFKGFYNKNGTLLTSRESEKPGYIFTGFIEADVFVADTVVIKYTVNGQLFSESVSVDVLAYVEKVDEAYGCGTLESQLVHSMLQYKLDLYRKVMGDAANSKIVAELEDRLVAHGADGADCKCGDINYIAPEEEKVDYSAISSLVKRFAYTLEIDRTEDEYKTSYSFSIFCTRKCGISSIIIGDKELDRYVGDDYVEFRYSNLTLSELHKVIEMTVVTYSETFTVTYSLANHIAESNVGDAFAKAMYVLSKAAVQQ